MATSSVSSTTSTPTFQFSGISSGIDTQGMIDALMQVEQQPLTRLQTQATALTDRANALTDVRSLYSDLMDKLRAFCERRAGEGVAATPADPTIVTASATSGAVASSYQVQVEHLATATVARSTASLGSAVTDGSLMLSALPLPGSVKAGTAGIVVDGAVVHVTVGDPKTTSLDDLGQAIATAISGQVAATDSGATVTYSIVNNRIQLTLGGATGSHAIAFGVAGDTSNALGILGLSMAGATLANGQSITSTSPLGVIQANAKLQDAFGVSGSGKLTINGTAISWNAASDTLTTVLSRINASSAGVTASIDRVNDRVVLTSRSGGSVPLDIQDTTGAMAAALKLSPGTTGAQTLGQDASVLVNGVRTLSHTNQVSNAIDGVTLNLVSQSAAATTVTVATDRTAITSALQDVVTSYNALVDKVDSYTKNDPNGTTRGPLVGDLAVTALLTSVRQQFFTQAPGLTGPYTSLGSIGLNTGAFGSAAGTTNHLQLDTARLNAAFDNNPAAVANLLDAANGALKPIADRIATYAGPVGIFYKEQQSILRQQSDVAKQESDMQSTLDAKRAALVAKFAQMESLLSSLNGTSSQLTSQTNAQYNSSNG